MTSETTESFTSNIIEIIKMRSQIIFDKISEAQCLIRDGAAYEAQEILTQLRLELVVDIMREDSEDARSTEPPDEIQLEIFPAINLKEDRHAVVIDNDVFD
jgi:hypothetical protein